MNDALLERWRSTGPKSMRLYGAPLEWKAHDAGGLMTKRTKVVAPKLSIGERTSPTEDGLLRACPVRPSPGRRRQTTPLRRAGDSDLAVDAVDADVSIDGLVDPITVT